MKVKEAAARLEVSAATVYGLVAAGKLRCYRVGLGRGCIRISEDHIAAYLAASEPAVLPPAPVPAPAPARRMKLKFLNLG